ncbi:putative reverse transcriptase domain-containing protein [Tanacetum coccineum]
MAKRGFSNNTLNDEEDGEDLLLDRYLDSSVRWVVRKTDHGRSHTSRYSIHPGADKMYHESERFVLWPGKKKKDIVESLADVMVDLRHTYDSSSRSVRKTTPRYVGPFEIVECVGPVAYRLKLPQELSCVHDTFHVSNLKKCLAEPDVQVPLDEIEIDENLRFVEEPIEIVERDVKKLKRRRIPLVKVRWNSRQGAEYTWEREDQFQKKYPHLFSEPVPSSSAAT